MNRSGSYVERLSRAALILALSGTFLLASCKRDPKDTLVPPPPDHLNASGEPMERGGRKG